MYKHGQRILWIDFIKGLCIFMVVFYHAIFFSGKNQFDNSAIEVALKYLFDVLMMPCFFAVSGYLYKPVTNIKNYLVLIYKKISSFIIPYIIFYIIFAVKYSNKFYLMDIVNLKHIILKPDGDLWFLQILLFIFVIVGALDLIHINRINQLSIFVLFLIIFLTIIAPLLPHVHMILQAFNIIFFLIGTLIKRYITFIKKNVITFVTVFMILFVLMIFTHFNYDAQFISFNTILPKSFGILALFGIAMNIHNTNKMFLYFVNIGKYTLIIYIVHFIPVLVSDYFLRTLTSSLLLNSLIVTVIGWMFSIIICYFSKKIKIINFVFYPRKYINKLFIKTRLGKYLLN